MNKVIKSYLFIGVFAIVSILGMALNTHVAFAANPCVINTYTSTATTIDAGKSVTFNWSVSDCTDVDLNGYPVTLTSITLTPSIGGTYDLILTAKSTVTNTFDTKTITLVVNNNTTAQDCTIDSFSSNTRFVDSGKPVTFYFTTTGCNNTVISDENGVSGYTSPYTAYPTRSGTYVLSATNTTTGLTKIDNIYITVNSAQALPQNPPCIISNFYASPNSVQSGGSATLYWNTNGNCKNVSVNGTSVNGSTLPISLSSTTNYVISGYSKSDNSQSNSLSIVVYVNNNNSQTTYKKDLAPQQNNTVDNSNCIINYFTANPSEITINQSTTLSWGTNNKCSQIDVNGTLISSNSLSVNPTKNTTYTLTGYSSNSKITPASQRVVYVKVNNPVVDLINKSTAGVPVVSTDQNMNINGNTVIISGSADPNGDSNMKVWFEYGTTDTLGSATQIQTLSVPVKPSAKINNLTQYTKYYFRIASQNSYGKSFGKTYSFTSGGPITKNGSQGSKIFGINNPLEIQGSTDGSTSNMTEDTINNTTKTNDTLNPNDILNNPQKSNNSLPASASSASSKGGFSFLWLLVLVIVILIIIIVTRSMRLKAKEADGEDHHHVAHH